MTLAMAPLVPVLKRRTAETDPEPGRPHAHSMLGSPEIRRGLTSMLRRRLPAQDVDDVAQTILCDAMAAERIPADPEELRRWLAGIARHKVVDFHRRAGRLRPTEHVDGVSRGVNHEDREVLARLLAEPRTRQDARTFEWLVREHDGDRLQDIAREEELPAPVVRQRVSRLRRALRSRWATALLLVLTLGGGLARRSFTETTIAPEPAASGHDAERPPTLLERAEGDWVLASVRPDRVLTATEQRVLALARDASVRVHGGSVRITAGTFEHAFRIDRVDGARVVLGDGKMSETLEVTAQSDRLVVHVRGGTVTLRRPTH